MTSRVAVAVVLTACLTLVTPVPFQPVPHPGDDAEGSLDAAADVRSLWDVSLQNVNSDQWHCTGGRTTFPTNSVIGGSGQYPARSDSDWWPLRDNVGLFSDNVHGWHTGFVTDNQFQDDPRPETQIKPGSDEHSIWPTMSAVNDVFSNGNVVSSPIDVPGWPLVTSDWEFPSLNTHADDHSLVDVHSRTNLYQNEFERRGVNETQDATVHVWQPNSNGHRLVDFRPSVNPCRCELDSQDVSEILQDSTSSTWPTDANGNFAFDIHTLTDLCDIDFESPGATEIVLQGLTHVNTWPADANAPLAVDIYPPADLCHIGFESQSATDVLQAATLSNWPTMHPGAAHVLHRFDPGCTTLQAEARISGASDSALSHRQELPGDSGRLMWTATSNLLSAGSPVLQPTLCSQDQDAIDQYDWNMFIPESPAPVPLHSLATSRHDGCTFPPFTLQPVGTQGSTEEPATMHGCQSQPSQNEHHGRGKYPRKKCEHGRLKHGCRVCCPHLFCTEHGRQKWGCRPCGGSGICVHRQIQYYCKACKGKGICQHGRRRSRCTACVRDRGQVGICEHNRRTNVTAEAVLRVSYANDRITDAQANARRNVGSVPQASIPPEAPPPPPVVKRRGGTFDAPSRGLLQYCRRAWQRLNIVLRVADELKQRQSKELTEGCRQFQCTVVKPVVACFQRHHGSNPEAFLARWPEFFPSKFGSKCCDASTDDCGTTKSKART